MYIDGGQGPSNQVYRAKLERRENFIDTVPIADIRCQMFSDGRMTPSNGTGNVTVLDLRHNSEQGVCQLRFFRKFHSILIDLLLI